MLNNYLKIIVIVIIVSFQLVYAQEKTITEIPQQDSITIEHLYKLKFNYYPNQTILSFKMPILIDDFSTFYLNDFTIEKNPRISSPLFNYRLQNNINKSFKIYLKRQKKNDLGFVGEVLGYTNAAAVLGLAAYHVYKYRDKYFRK